MIILPYTVSSERLVALAGGGGSGGGFSGGGGSFSGGGSSGGSSSGSGSAFLVFPFFIFIIIFIIASVWARRVKKRTILKNDIALDAMAETDTLWNRQTMTTHAEETFLAFQKDWSDFNLASMKTYMTPNYYQHNLLMMDALKAAGRRNDVQNPKVLHAGITSFDNEPEKSNDTYAVAIRLSAQDVTIDTIEDKVLFARYTTVVETYKFKRSEDTWLLAGIDEETADHNSAQSSIQDFALKNGYFYSLDWGWLLLPKRGQLFGAAKFGTSDINNHVIGLYNDILIQLYTYSPVPQKTTSYLIAQTNLPKSYGDIVVRRRKGLFQSKIHGLTQVSMEWQEFNKVYQVFATSTEQATSFELLNPLFMEQLEALPFEVNIEVVDNVVYLYAANNGVPSEAQYVTMLSVLKAAFKEMKL